jgi:uncharacterized protein
MLSLRIRERSWRFYRNWLIHFVMWVVLVLIALRAARQPWPLYIYVVLAYPIYLVASSIFFSYRITHPRGRFAMRRVTPDDAGMAYEKVEFPSQDGLTLFGWFMPGNSEATIILLHGHGGKGIAMIYHASALVAKGYSVFSYDQRAHGSSAGDVCTSGWKEADDVIAALDYLKTRPDVDPERIGALGLSLGGQAALLAAAREERLRAVIAEGPGATCLADHGGRPNSLQRWINYPTNWLFHIVFSLMNGFRPTQGIRNTIADIAPRPILLISSGRKSERHFTQLFYEAAQEPKDLWVVPAARHAEVYFQDAKAYQKRIVDFFDRAFEVET